MKNPYLIHRNNG